MAISKIPSRLLALHGRLSLGWRLVFGATVCAALTCTAAVGITMHRVDSELHRLGMEKIDQDMRTLTAEVHARGWPARIQDGKLYFGAYPVNGETAVVDAVKAIAGGTVTIFEAEGADFVRIATNVPGPHGGRAVGTTLARNAAYAANLAGEGFRGRVDILGTKYFTGYDPIKDANGRVVGIFYVGEPEAMFMAATHQVVRAAVLTAIVVLVFAAAMLWLSTRRTLRPLLRMESAMAELSAGRMEVEIPGRQRGDEIGRMANALAVFRDKLAEAAETARESARADERVRLEHAEDRRVLADHFDAEVKSAIDAFSDSAAALGRMAGEMEAIAGQTSADGEKVALAADHATANVQTVAAAAEQLSASIAEIGRRVVESSAAAREAALQAEQTTATVTQMSAVAERIGDFVGLIGQISQQTNLLALNATIEAARAGAAGKGFAVVASEVKTLAVQAARATEEIGRLVAEIRGVTSKAVEAITAIGGAIARVNADGDAIAAAVTQQDAATQEIARNVQQVAGGTGDVTHTIANVAKAAVQGRQTAQALSAAVGQLTGNATQLRQGVDTFLGSIQAG